MHNTTQRALLAALGARLKAEPPLVSSGLLDEALHGSLPPGSRKPTGAAAAAAQDAWDTL